jgi:hypothetical protein
MSTGTGGSRLQGTVNVGARADVVMPSFDFIFGSDPSAEAVPIELGILYAAISDVLESCGKRIASPSEAALMEDPAALRDRCAELLRLMTIEQRLFVLDSAEKLARR